MARAIKLPLVVALGVLSLCKWAPHNASAQALPFFPGAEGYGGSFLGAPPAEGWFSNATVYHVTNLNDSGPGSFRNAFQENTSNRIIVFDVAGTIQLNSKVDIKNLSNYYIAGQTAPGPVTVYGQSTNITHSSDKNNTNVILRYMTFRKGTGDGEDALTFAGGDSPSDAGRGRNMILDHVSVSWAEDENLSVANNNTNITVQHSVIADALGGTHAYASLIRPRSDASVTFHHNLYANNLSRQPRLGTYNAETLTADVRNNVIYNWGNRATYAGGSSEPEREFVDVNYVGNYLIAGPASGSNTTRAFIVDRNVDVRAYQSGNMIDSDRLVNPGGIPNGNDTGWGMFQVTGGSPAGTLTQLSTPHDVAPVVTQSALDAYHSVIDHAGNSRWGRDAIDARIVGNVLNNTQPSTGVGGAAPVAAELIALLNAPQIQHPAGWDSDSDGMPDYWEVAHQLNPLSNSDWRLDFDGDGYVNLIEYVNEIGEFPAPTPIVFTGNQNARYAQIHNWDITWQPSRFDEVQINSGLAVVDAVGQHARVVNLGSNPGDTAALQITGGWLAVAEDMVIGADNGAAAMLVMTGGRLTAQRLIRGAGGTFAFDGGRLQADYVGFDLTNRGGTVAPGLTQRELSIDGSYVHDGAASMLEIDIGGTAKGLDYSVLDVVGPMTVVSGSLDVSFVNGFVPVAGTSFDILDFNSWQGGFTAVNLPGGPAVWNQSRLSLDGILTYVGALGGDFNGDGQFDCFDVNGLVAEIVSGNNTTTFDVNSDGVVNQLDLTQWLANAGAVNLPSGNSYLNGDANLDGVVDGSDFGVWNANKFTASAGWCAGDFTADGATDGSDFGLWNANKFQSSDATSLVPEPCMGAGIFLLFLALARRPRRTA